MIRRIAIAIVAAAVLGLLGFFLLAWRPAIAPIEPLSRASFPAESLAKGEILAAGGHCGRATPGKADSRFLAGMHCAPSSGLSIRPTSRPIRRPASAVDRLEAFASAMREGVSRDGSHLFPAFPCDHYTKLSDDDVKALYAYFMTRPPVRATAPANTIPFPLNIRALQEGWKIVFFRNGRYQNTSSTTQASHMPLRSDQPQVA
jgi:hypothetical protein